MITWERGSNPLYPSNLKSDTFMIITFKDGTTRTVSTATGEALLAHQEKGDAERVVAYDSIQRGSITIEMEQIKSID